MLNLFPTPVLLLYLPNPPLPQLVPSTQTLGAELSPAKRHVAEDSSLGVKVKVKHSSPTHLLF